MPELPEVETVRRGLARSVVGKRIEEVTIFDPSLVKGLSAGAFVRGLERRSIAEVSRRGKYLLFRLDSGKTWAVHLRMTGRMLFKKNDRPVREKATRAILKFGRDGLHPKGCSFLWFSDSRRFGEWHLVRKPEEIPGIAKLGPEPLEITREEFVQRLKSRRGQIKPLLLDQAFLGGLGNIYACEALYRAGINPKRKPCSISFYNKIELYHNIQVILKEAIRAGGASVRSYRRSDGSKGWFALRLKVYGREGSKCSRCCRTIRRIKLSGRGTYYCPGCQK